MRHFRQIALAIFLSSSTLAATSGPASAQVAVDIVFHANIAPPPLPVYDQPPIPGDDYIWTPGYWAWDDDSGDYYWVPGTWVEAPERGYLWTPGYWGYSDNVYVFHQGYWGTEVGFYGGVVYGFGYTGAGYEGGYWRDNNFFYNSTVNNVTNVNIHITNVYQKTIINNTTINNVSYNGPGGLTARPSQQQVALANVRHIQPTQIQLHNQQAAHSNPSLFMSKNHGNPPVASTSHAGVFSGQGIVPAKATGTAPSPQKPAATPPAAPGGAQPQNTPQKSGTPTVTQHAPAGQVHTPVVPKETVAKPVTHQPELRVHQNTNTANHPQPQIHRVVTNHPSQPHVSKPAPVHAAVTPQVHNRPQVVNHPAPHNPPAVHRAPPKRCGAPGEPKC